MDADARQMVKVLAAIHENVRWFDRMTDEERRYQLEIIVLITAPYMERFKKI
jgi:hypothetical protein